MKLSDRLIWESEIKKREHDVVLKDGAKHRCFDTTMLTEIPTAIKVVRCKDCKFGEYDEDFPNQYYCPNWGCAFRSDWYCADGEEREDAETN